MRRLALVLALLSLLGGTTLAEAAGSGHNSWHLAATHSSTVRVTLTAPVQIDVDQINFDIENGRRSLASVISMDGHFGGMQVRDSSHVVFGVLALAGHPHLIGWGAYDDDARQILPSGRYTITVFGDGPVTIDLPLIKGAALTASPSRPARVRTTYQNDLGTISSQSPAASMQSPPLTLRRGGSYLVMAAHGSGISGPGAEVLCLTVTDNAGCTHPAQIMLGTSGMIVGQDAREVAAMFGDSTIVHPGTYVARYTLAEASQSTGRQLLTAVFAG
jgi:hypothetical protein